MRLQSAIFTLPDALLDGGALRPGADKVLSILKMELMVPKEVMAKDLADRFRKNTEQLYASVINALFEAPREKKE